MSVLCEFILLRSIVVFFVVKHCSSKCWENDSLFDIYQVITMVSSLVVNNMLHYLSFLVFGCIVLVHNTVVTFTVIIHFFPFFFWLSLVSWFKSNTLFSTHTIHVNYLTYYYRHIINGVYVWIIPHFLSHLLRLCCPRPVGFLLEKHGCLVTVHVRRSRLSVTLATIWTLKVHIMIQLLTTQCVHIVHSLVLVVFLFLVYIHTCVFYIHIHMNMIPCAKQREQKKPMT